MQNDQLAGRLNTAYYIIAYVTHMDKKNDTFLQTIGSFVVCFHGRPMSHICTKDVWRHKFFFRNLSGQNLLRVLMDVSSMTKCIESLV